MQFHTTQQQLFDFYHHPIFYLNLFTMENYCNNLSSTYDTLLCLETDTFAYLFGDDVSVVMNRSETSMNFG